jgi:hypothetical protein
MDTIVNKKIKLREAYDMAMHTVMPGKLVGLLSINRKSLNEDIRNKLMSEFIALPEIRSKLDTLAEKEEAIDFDSFTVSLIDFCHKKGLTHSA